MRFERVAIAAAMVMSLPIAQANELNIQWLGGPTMLIEFGNIQLLTDPMLGEGEKAYRMADPNEAFDLKQGPNVKDHARLAPLPDFDLQQVDAVLISHTHEDHFDQVAREILPKSLPVVIPESDIALMSSLKFSNSQALIWGDTWRLEDGSHKVTITAIPAYHTLAPAMESLLGHGNGYWMTFEQGDWRKSLYWSGDSFMTPELISTVRKLGQPDVFVPHVGRVGTTGPLGMISMGAQEVREAILQLQPGRTLPIHHSTYALYLEPVSVLVELANQSQLPVDVVSEGGVLTYR
ncbi:MBL fold metallo-hydrolase [Photobacterium sp. WH77]|uniref:MBL fold metallo-hydrolase n=1 Tax=Photobacterium TaxID=657 RepID=UPI001C47EB6E|nr:MULTISPECIES: MBL fold metallo-hydrolase [Photobacterium]MBV7263384.1 MBL fold metallo-hydrolase [Photobacterium sp. WH24]MCG2838044.1 MBL fold metallo-hydrolase [Photobacterium sp. WH77]MCG2845662.1 MBL fold metallo-hydrolase [Photobacterium sp. WH80]MDO6583759.1 MBL fold metallo-hydrolase [Photobacterium sp. 2_MG-2023]